MEDLCLEKGFQPLSSIKDATVRDWVDLPGQYFVALSKLHLMFHMKIKQTEIHFTNP